jgi:hypothetical protein
MQSLTYPSLPTSPSAGQPIEPMVKRTALRLRMLEDLERYLSRGLACPNPISLFGKIRKSPAENKIQSRSESAPW